MLRDRNWSFPLKLHLVTLAAGRCRRPVHIFSCGVDRHWSWLGGRLLRQVLSQSVSISVRDRISQEQLQRLAPGITCQLTADPALWTAALYPSTGQTPHLGLGLIHPWQIQFRGRAPIAPERWESFWLELIRRLRRRGASCELFTNGNPADHEFAQRVHAKALQQDLECSLASRPFQPAELAATIRRYRAVLALRLHANIIAASYHTPAVGLSWSEKVKGFYEALGYPRRCLSLDRLDATETIDALLGALREGLATERVTHLKETTRRNMQKIVAQMTSAAS